jgi:Na+-exporting ATPase
VRLPPIAHETYFIFPNQWTEMAGKKTKTVAPTFSKPPYQLSYQQVADGLGTSIENGLSQQQVEENTAKYGENKLDGEGAISPWKILIKQVANAM